MSHMETISVVSFLPLEFLSEGGDTMGSLEGR